MLQVRSNGLCLIFSAYKGFIAVLDVNRVAGVIQAVVQQNGKTTGEI